MIDLNKNFRKQVLGVTCAIMAVAFVLSTGSKVLAQTAGDSAPVATETVAPAASASEGHGLDRVIKGTENWGEEHEINVGKFIQNIGKSTGIYQMIKQQRVDPNPTGVMPEVKETPQTDWGKAPGWQSLIMIAIGFLIVYLAVGKGFEPLLLIPIGFGTILVNIVGAGMGDLPDGMLAIIYKAGVGNEFFPMLIFMGIGAMTDFGPLIANPKTAILGGAAQFGVFFTLFGVAIMNMFGLNYNIMQACAIGIIGGADGPTSIYVSGKLAPELMGVIAVAAYSYMALVPVIQPPIMKLLTTEAERKIQMTQLREVSKREKIVFPLMILLLCVIFLPSACPLLGALCFGNLCKECGVVDRLSDTMQNALINIVTIFLGLSVGSKLSASQFLTVQTLFILLLGIIAFSLATGAGVLMAKLMNLCSKTKINPLIGSAGVSAVPMAARVSNKVGLEANPQNFLLMHAMGPNVAGVIGSAVAAGVLLALCH